MTEERQFDNTIINYVGNPVFEVDYLNNLNDATINLSTKDAPYYFQYLLQHFVSNNVYQFKRFPEAATAILKSIRKVIRREEIYEVFKTKGFNLLPYGQYPKDLYPILNDLIQKDPEIFCQNDEEIQPNLVKTFVSDPKKGLSVIAKAAKKFVKDPTLYLWNVLDVLRDKSVISCVKDDQELLTSFLSIIVYLCQKSDEYRKGRLISWFADINKYILAKDTDKEVLRQIYITLCYLRDEAKEFDKMKQLQLQLPLDKMIEHLSYEKAQGPILALLVDRAELNPDELNNQNLIKKLFYIAEKNNNLKATIVLMKLATSENLVSEVFGDGDWLLKKLPETVDTIRLFLVIFEHKDMRPEIAQNQDFIPFLKLIIEKLHSSGVITIVCTIVRRIPLDQELVEQMGKQGLVRSFIDVSLNTDDESKVSYHSLLLFLNTISERAYLDDYAKITTFVANETMKDRSLSEIASYVAVTLAQYKKCKEKFLELHLDDFFRKKRDDNGSKRLAKNAEKFLRIIGGD